MQQAIDQILQTVTSRATAEVARQELQERLAGLEQEHTRRVTELEVQHTRALAVLQEEHARNTAALEGERTQRDQRIATLECRHEQQQQELVAAVRERDAARQDRFALRQRVAQLEEQARLQSKCGAPVTRQVDLLRHVLAATVDFSCFTPRRIVAAGTHGVVLQCGISVPDWCVMGSASAGSRRSGTALAEVEVAVKVLAISENPHHTKLKSHFLREYMTLSEFPPHPNIVASLAHLTKTLSATMFAMLAAAGASRVGQPSDPVLALVMPLHPRTLEAAAADAEPAQLLRWCLEVSAAVAHMWAYRWVHLDLKLNNVLVAADGRAVLTDMGTAMRVDGDGLLTVSVQMGFEGNPAHEAPEVLAGFEHAHRCRENVVRVDCGRQEVWALGVLLHELVAKKHPYGEYPGEGHEGGAAVDEATLTARGLPPAFVAVLRRMVSSDPALRPANPSDAYAELLACVPADTRAMVPSPTLPSADASEAPSLPWHGAPDGHAVVQERAAKGVAVTPAAAAVSRGVVDAGQKEYWRALLRRCWEVILTLLGCLFGMLSCIGLVFVLLFVVSMLSAATGKSEL